MHSWLSIQISMRCNSCAGLDPEAGEECGQHSKRVYCMAVPAEDFQEASLQLHALGSTCAPGGLRSVHDALHSDYCAIRWPATQSVYFSEERCSLVPGVQCS
jgi:hypothetical protein